MFKTEEGLKAGKVISNTATAWIMGFIVLGVILGGTLIDWTGFVLLGSAAIIAVLTLNSIVIIPTVYFGIPTRFKERIKKMKDSKPEAKVLEEGVNFVLPLVDDLLPDNTKFRKLTTEEVKVTALSKDKLEIILRGSVQYRPKNLNTYIEMTPKTIKEGMIDAVESELGKICGVEDADTFVEKRSEVELLIQSVLQLERPPHHYIDEDKAGKIDKIKEEAKEVKKLAGWEETSDEFKDVDKLEVVADANKVMGIVLKKEIVENIKKDPDVKEIVEKLSPEKWILEKKVAKVADVDVVRFYKDNVSRISILFKIPFEEESEVETLYGIKVATFRLAQLSFSKTAQEAFEKVRSAKAEMEAAEKRFETKVELLRKYIQAGLSPIQAVNLVETTSDVKGVNRQIISVEGSQQTDLLAFAKLLAGAKGGEK